jgi:uncharacterized protein (DUF58 family)
LWSLGASVLVLAGAAVGSWPVAAMGVVSTAILCALYLGFYPTSILIWRRHLELKWHLELKSDAPGGGFVVGRPFQLRVALRNRAPRPLGRATVRVFCSSTLEGPGELVLPLGARSEASTRADMVALQVGTWFLHGAAVELTDPLGLCTVDAYFPNALALQVFPRPQVRGAPIVPRPTAGAPHERLGLHAMRLRGLGGDLRELRDHAPGDPFKQIAWKATARAGKLMVRDLDRETMVTHFLLVDVGPTMRLGRPGSTKLDFAIDLATSYARAALEAGDRVGLLTYDSRIVAEVRANDGPVHRLRLAEPLLEAMNPVDEDLTEVTDSELISMVARYLAYQEGVDVRLPRTPAIDDPQWAYLASSPAGELYDLRVLHRAVESSLKTTPPRGAPRAANGELAKLRAFCRMRGVELPYRRGSQAGRRVSGLGEALERAATGRGAERILVVSDLEGLDGNLDAVVRAVRLARRRGHHLVCAAPSARLFAGSDAVRDPALAEILHWDAERRERVAFRRIAALGVRVVPVGPGEATPFSTEVVRPPVRKSA